MGQGSRSRAAGLEQWLQLDRSLPGEGSGSSCVLGLCGLQALPHPHLWEGWSLGGTMH